VYAIDLLGQGQSWPTQVQCQQSGPLCYSADTWTEQLFHFIEEKIGQPVYIAGNSLGEMH
jgi:pimeloyl-ACP methyl ester carboxylesterase